MLRRRRIGLESKGARLPDASLRVKRRPLQSQRDESSILHYCGAGSGYLVWVDLVWLGVAAGGDGDGGGDRGGNRGGGVVDPAGERCEGPFGREPLNR